jgi:uncharacterized protein
LISVKNVFNDESVRLQIDTDVDFSHITVGETPVFKTPVSVNGVIYNRAGVVILEYTAKFTYNAPCDRCAKEVERDFTFDFEHILVSQLNNEDTGDFLVVEDMQLDVDKLVTDDVLLSLPEKYLCKEDCKGLCSQCGANLNDGECGCKPLVDSRLEGLLDLLD